MFEKGTLILEKYADLTTWLPWFSELEYIVQWLVKIFSDLNKLEILVKFHTLFAPDHNYTLQKASGSPTAPALQHSTLSIQPNNLEMIAL